MIIAVVDRVDLFAGAGQTFRKDPLALYPVGVNNAIDSIDPGFDPGQVVECKCGGKAGFGLQIQQLLTCRLGQAQRRNEYE